MITAKQYVHSNTEVNLKGKLYLRINYHMGYKRFEKYINPKGFCHNSFKNITFEKVKLKVL